jgi:uncharacterized repeat protein (TIGR04138 family)
MKDQAFLLTIQKILDKDSRFSPEAYTFINDAVVYTVSKINAEKDRKERHISGLELLEGIKDFAVSQFGPMAYEVLSSWGLNDSMSIGYVVFNMVDHQLLGKSDNDSIADFDNSFNLKEQLTKPFLPSDPDITYTDPPIDL